MWRSVIRYFGYRTFGRTFCLLSILPSTWRQQFPRNNNIYLAGWISRLGWRIVGENVISYDDERRLCIVLGLRAYRKMFLPNNSSPPAPVAARSKAKFCGHSPAEIVVSNSTVGIDVCLLWVLCVVRQRSVRRADHSSRGVLPNMVRRLCVI